MRQIQIIGHIGQDAIIDTGDSGNEFVAFSVAESEKYTDQDGSRHEYTEWFRVTSFHPFHVKICQYLTKGVRVFVQGKPVNKPYQKKDGEVVVDQYIRAYIIEMLGGGKKADQDRPASVVYPSAAVPGVTHGQDYPQAIFNANRKDDLFF